MALLPNLVYASTLGDPPQRSSRSILGYTENGPMARVGFRWFALVEIEDDPPLLVWTRSHHDAVKVLRASASPESGKPS